MLYLEAEASGAFVKSELETRAVPEKAVENAVLSARQLAVYLADQLKPVLTERGMSAEVSFGIRCDGSGTVMIAQELSKGQFACRLTIQP